MEPEAFDFTSENQATYRVKIEGRLIDEGDGLGGYDEGNDEVDGEEEKEDDKEKGKEQEKEKEKDADGDSMEQEKEKEKEKEEGADGDPMEQDGGPVKKDTENAKAKAKAAAKPRPKFSHFFKTITIDFDRSKALQPEGMGQITWKKAEKRPGTGSSSVAGAAASADGDFDCLEFSRKGDENINITINLVRDENPERFKVSKALADVIDSDEEDRAGVVMKLWEYIRAKGLQQDDENRRIQCDEKLRAVSCCFLYL